MVAPAARVACWVRGVALLAVIGTSTALSGMDVAPPRYRLSLRGGGGEGGSRGFSPLRPDSVLSRVGPVPMDMMGPQTIAWHAAQGALMTCVPRLFMKAYGSPMSLSARSVWNLQMWGTSSLGCSLLLGMLQAGYSLRVALGAYLLASGGMLFAMMLPAVEEEPWRDEESTGLKLFGLVSCAAGLITMTDRVHGIKIGWALCAILLAQSAAIVGSTLGSEQPWKCLYRGSRVPIVASALYSLCFGLNPAVAMATLWGTTTLHFAHKAWTREHRVFKCKSGIPVAVLALVSAFFTFSAVSAAIK